MKLEITLWDERENLFGVNFLVFHCYWRHNSQFYISRLQGCDHMCICIVICLKGQDCTYMCVRSISQACALLLFHIPEVTPATECVSYWDALTACSGCLLPPIVLATSPAQGQVLFTAPQNINAGYPSLCKWGKWDPKVGCHLHGNSDPLCFSLLLTPPILLTNGSGGVILYSTCGCSACASSHGAQWVKGSELRDAWVKGFSKDWIPLLTEVSCFVCSWLGSEMESCLLVPHPLTVSSVLSPAPWAPYSGSLFAKAGSHRARGVRLARNQASSAPQTHLLGCCSMPGPKSFSPLPRPGF